MIWTLLFCLFGCSALSASALELTFELPDQAKECFHETISPDQNVTVDYQVVTGGAYDVDVVLLDPHQNVIYQKTKSTYDAIHFKTDSEGIYSICFSNEFSTFTHKLVYMEFKVGDDAPLQGVEQQITVMTQMESSMTEVHESLKKVEEFQTFHRLQETQSRKRAEDLNERVLLWSVVETLGIIVVSITQVFVVRTLFSEKRPSTIQSRYVVH